MNRRLLFLILLAGLGFFACQSPEGFVRPSDSLEAGRGFVRAVLDGDFNKAELFIIPDEEDRSLFKRYESYMKKRPEAERLGLKSASILIHNIDNTSDSVSIIKFSNSFTNEPAELKVVRLEGDWWVDFSYTFSGNLPED